MITIILAAGKGSRLKLKTKSKFAYSIPFLMLTPDILKQKNINVEDEFLVENIFKGLKNINSSFLFVLGYKFLNVTPLLSYLMHKYGKRVDYVVNTKYYKTNTGYSLLLALEAIIGEDNDYLDDILIINGDNFLSNDAWKKILEKIKENKSFIVVDTYKKLTAESFKVKIENKKIINMGKNINISSSTGEFIGVSFLRKEDVLPFFNILKDLVNRNKNIYYDLAFKNFSQIYDLDYLYLQGELWTEIDFKEDLENLKKILTNNC